jgi:spermidine synthase
MLPYVLMSIAIWREAPTDHRRPITWLATAGVLGLGIAAFVVPSLQSTRNTVESSRNFYGVLRVLDDRGDSLYPIRHLWHGRITHGTQFLNPADRQRTTAYYADGSGVEIAMRHHPKRLSGQPLAIGAIGLGVGTIAAYGQPGDTLRFYEINPDVERMAREHFTFMADSKAEVDVVLGDGRLSLEREVESGEGRGRYDVLVADAFAGDAVPVHLLTREAMELYWQALKQDGVLAIHISNRYLNLARVVSGLVPAVQKRLVRIRRPGGGAAFGSTWLLVSSNQQFLRYLVNNITHGADIPAEPPVVWSDAFSNLYEVFGDAIP